MFNSVLGRYSGIVTIAMGSPHYSAASNSKLPAIGTAIHFLLAESGTSGLLIRNGITGIGLG